MKKQILNRFLRVLYPSVVFVVLIAARVFTDHDPGQNFQHLKRADYVATAVPIEENRSYLSRGGLPGEWVAQAGPSSSSMPSSVKDQPMTSAQLELQKSAPVQMRQVARTTTQPHLVRKLVTVEVRYVALGRVHYARRQFFYWLRT